MKVPSMVDMASCALDESSNVMKPYLKVIKFKETVDADTLSRLCHVLLFPFD